MPPMGRAAKRATKLAHGHLETIFGGPARTRVIVLFGCVLAMSSADTATVGASATQLRHALAINNTDIGLLVTVGSVVAAIASLPFGVLADRVRRNRTLGVSVLLWGIAMLWSATARTFSELLIARLFLGIVTAAAGPVIASMVGDYFPSSERGRVYSYMLTGELLGAGFGFAVSGDVAALSWRAAFVVLALPTFVLARAIMRLPEPVRGGSHPLPRTGDADTDQPGEPITEEHRHETDAQRVARKRGITPQPDMVLRSDPRRMGIWSAIRYVLKIRSNVILVIAGACGYFYLAGIETFGIEFVKGQYGIGQALANLLLLVIGAGAIVGVLVGGNASDALLHRRHVNARVLVAAVAATATVLLFLPAILTRSAITALPYLTFAAFALSAQNAPLDAARLDIVPPLLWGRASGITTLLRTLAQSLAPLLFGVVADLLGGGRAGLQWSFLIMLAPLSTNAVFLFKATRTYPRDVATAAASAAYERGPTAWRPAASGPAASGPAA